MQVKANSLGYLKSVDSEDNLTHFWLLELPRKIVSDQHPMIVFDWQGINSRQHPTTQVFLHAGCPLCHPTSSVKALMA